VEKERGEGQPTVKFEMKNRRETCGEGDSICTFSRSFLKLSAQAGAAFGGQRPSFATSNFKQHYEEATSTQFQDELMGAVRKMIQSFCASGTIDSQACPYSCRSLKVVNGTAQVIFILNEDKYCLKSHMCTTGTFQTFHNQIAAGIAGLV
jgi:hypothetical protein